MPQPFNKAAPLHLALMAHVAERREVEQPIRLPLLAYKEVSGTVGFGSYHGTEALATLLEGKQLEEAELYLIGEQVGSESTFVNFTPEGVTGFVITQHQATSFYPLANLNDQGVEHCRLISEAVGYDFASSYIPIQSAGHTVISRLELWVEPSSSETPLEAVLGALKVEAEARDTQGTCIAPFALFIGGADGQVLLAELPEGSCPERCVPVAEDVGSVVTGFCFPRWALEVPDGHRVMTFSPIGNSPPVDRIFVAAGLDELVVASAPLGNDKEGDGFEAYSPEQLLQEHPIAVAVEGFQRCSKSVCYAAREQAESSSADLEAGGTPSGLEELSIALEEFGVRVLHTDDTPDLEAGLEELATALGVRVVYIDDTPDLEAVSKPKRQSKKKSVKKDKKLNSKKGRRR